MLASGATNWITAVGSAFAAVGTVGAVIVVLWHVLRHDRRRVRVECYFGARITGGRALFLQATNCSRRAVSLSTVALVMADGSQLVPPTAGGLGRLPAVLADGESVAVTWTADELEHTGGRYLYGCFRDSMLNVYRAPVPGVKSRRSRRGLRREHVASGRGAPASVRGDASSLGVAGPSTRFQSRERDTYSDRRRTATGENT
jgi:hypothetical protein